MNTTTRWSYSPNGVTTSFAYDNKLLDAADLVVSWVGSDGNPLTLPGYSVTGVGVDTGGSVVFNTAPATAAGSKIVLERRTSPLQSGTFLDFLQEDAATRQERYDRCLLLAQEFRTALGRMLLYSPLDADGAVVLPPAASRANRALLFDALGRATVGNPLSPGVLVASAYFQTLFGSADAPALLTALGFSAYMRGLVGSTGAAALLTAEGWSAFMQTLKGSVDGPTLRTAIGVPVTWSVGTDMNSAATIDLDSATTGDERGIATAGTAIATINGSQRLVRLVAKADGVTLTHDNAKIVSRTASDIVMRNGDAVTLARTGAAVWREVSFDPVPTWKSGNLTVVNATILAAVPHYLGKRVGPPRLMGRCTSNNADYTPAMFAGGKRIEFCRGIQQNVGWAAIVSDSDVTVQIAFSGLGIVYGASGDGTSPIDPTKWDIWLEIDPRN